MLESNSKHLFCDFDDIYKYKKLRFFKIEAARKATQTKTTKRVFSKKGRPQGNTNKNDEAFIFKKQSFYKATIDNAKHGKWDGYGPLRDLMSTSTSPFDMLNSPLGKIFQTEEF